MAQVIFETIIRGQSHYHKIHNFPASIGRAFDNDIILSDPSVSPHHLIIDENKNGCMLRNISDENGTLLNKQPMDSLATAIKLPVTVNLGDLKARILSHKTAVEPTRIKPQSNGLFHFLSKPLWVSSLFFMTLVFIFIDRYQSIPLKRDLLFYFSELLPTLLVMLGITLIIGSISRLFTHRWEIFSALGITSLFFFTPLLLDYLGHFFNYLLTSDLPSNIFTHIAHFLLLPALLMFYMIRVHLIPWFPALGAAILVSSPISAYHLNDQIDQLSSNSGFSPLPPYNQTLSSLDIHTANSISLKDYFNNASRILAEQTNAMLKEELEKNK
ncbi:MAG TPA: FHA domain-containing protein [Leucothrix mucor]|uniref:FHA domain-containing protein n=1 Tax=Leucothrix mucor TaxID=45248 RepID=A0A7V2SYW8_LEUMU|nr:FHA domain-containing protein [Leucothrix mucor]